MHISGASSANLLRIDSPASSSIIFVSGSGNVGIGTAAPTVALQVGDTTSTGNYIKVLGNNSDSTYDVFVGARRYPRLQLQDTTVGGSTFQMWSLGNTMRFGTNTGTTETSAWYTKSGNAADVIFNGNVGIGIVSPTAKLDVSGSLNISGSGVQVPLQVSSGNTSLLFVSSSGNVGIGTTTPSFKLDISGNNNRIRVLGTTGYVALDLQNSAASFYVAREGSVGGSFATGTTAYSGVLSVQGAYSMHLATNGTISTTISSTGNVGIGTTTPNAKLDVNGNTTITGSLAVSASIFQYSNNAAITSGSTANIASFSTSSFTAGFFDFVATSGTNARAGTVFTVWNANNVEYAETSTNDIGNTTNLLLSASISAGAIRLQGTSLSGSWNVKTLTRMI